MKEIQIDGKHIGRSHKPYIIAELSANHNGSLDKALETIQMAFDSGADAIKLQTYTADSMTIDCDLPDFQINGGLWDGYKLYDLYGEAQTPYEWHKVMFDKARELGITIFSTPFDEQAVDFLETLDVPAYKIASFEAVDLPLIRKVASTGKPMIISTGMANLEEIEEAVDTAMAAGCSELVLLHCISGYPSPFDQANLATIKDLESKFGCIVGLSDHTMGTAVSVAAVALGASLIEKHVIIDRNDKGPDSEFSLEPHELRDLCISTNIAWQAIGKVGYHRKPVEESNVIFRRSVYFVKDMMAGEVITNKCIRRIRPGHGLAPKFCEGLIGKQVSKDIKRGTPTSWDLIND